MPNANTSSKVLFEGIGGSCGISGRSLEILWAPLGPMGVDSEALVSCAFYKKPKTNTSAGNLERALGSLWGFMGPLHVCEPKHACHLLSRLSSDTQLPMSQTRNPSPLALMQQKMDHIFYGWPLFLYMSDDGNNNGGCHLTFTKGAAPHKKLTSILVLQQGKGIWDFLLLTLQAALGTKTTIASATLT